MENEPRFAIYVKVNTPQGRSNVPQTIDSFLKRLESVAPQHQATVLKDCSHVTGGRFDAVIYVTTAAPMAILPLVYAANQDGQLLTETVPAAPITDLAQLATWSRSGSTAEQTSRR